MKVAALFIIILMSSLSSHSSQGPISGVLGSRLQSCYLLLLDAQEKEGEAALQLVLENIGRFSPWDQNVLRLTARYDSVELEKISEPGRALIREILDSHMRREPVQSSPTSGMGLLTKSDEPARQAFKDQVRLKKYDLAIQTFDHELSPSTKEEPYFQQQVAMALTKRNNRGLKDRTRAVNILTESLRRNGSSSETWGLIGAAYKAEYYDSLQIGGAPSVLNELLDRAIEAYRTGFRIQQQDYYPGINLINLLAIRNSPTDQSEIRRTAPVVRFAVETVLMGQPRDFWALATLLQLDLHVLDFSSAQDSLVRLIDLSSTLQIPLWQMETTLHDIQAHARNLEDSNSSLQVMRIWERLNTHVLERRRLNQ